ncbi:MAG: Hpt domain-containing protein [Bacteroidia bacterium]|nr:Hpt domain-containing protein [Bacteroidia bacterium]
MTLDSTIPTSNKLYNLSFIDTVCRGNQVVKKKMLDTFLSTIPLDVVKIKNAHIEGDFETVSQVAHKIKPVLATYGINSISEDIHAIEMLAKDEPGHPEIGNKIELVVNTVNLVAQDIKINFL